MSKVLVDRELLEKHVIEIDSWNASMEKIIGKQPDYRWESLETLREALAQPAEAEGVEVVAFQVRRTAWGTTSNLYTEKLPFVPGEGVTQYSEPTALIRLSDHLTALSAVTAEREAESCEHWRTLALQFDRHRMSALAHLKMVVAGQDGARDACRDFLSAPPVPGHAITEEIDQLRAEVEALREDAERYRWLIDSGNDTYSMFVEAEDKAALDAAIDAAMAAKESEL